MTQFEYKAVPAPERTEKVKGLRTTSERFANSLTGVLNDMARDGWEFLRAETLPCEERSGLLRRARVSEQHMLVFRRALARSDAAQGTAAQLVAPRTEAARPASPLAAGRGGHEEPLLSRRAGGNDEPPQRG